jgi:hypothetical protein
MSEAEARASGNIDREVDMQRLLMDQYLSPVFRRHKLSAFDSPRVNVLCVNRALGR